MGRIAEVQKRLLQETMDRATRDELLERLARLEDEEFALRTRIADADRSFALLHRPTIPSVDDIRERLAPDQAILSFWTAWPVETLTATSWVLVLTSEDARIHAVPGLEDLSTRVDTYLGLLRRRDALERYAAARLYDDLFRDALGGLTPDVTKLVIVPDAALVRLPFGALRESPDSEPVSARYDVTLTPSAATWLRLKEQTARDDREPILALADPPIVSGTPGDGMRNTVSWAEGFRLARLPGTRHEARSVVRRVGGNTTPWTGADASERALKDADLRDYAVLLLATHTVIDDDHPDRTAVFLAPGHDEEDGLLQAREIAGLDLDGQTIVLSGCSSATGEFLSGEGVLGIARSFFVAGAGAVVGSLWAQEDREVAVLIEAFAEHLADGSSVSGALAGAQRDLQRAGAPVAAWAGMVVLGDGDLVPFPGGRPVYRSWWWIAIPAVAFLALLAVAARLRAARA
jgi:CHAT domain-containing protein